MIENEEIQNYRTLKRSKARLSMGLVIFTVFNGKKLKKLEICSKILQKNHFFWNILTSVLSAQHPNAGQNIQQWS